MDDSALPVRHQRPYRTAQKQYRGDSMNTDGKIVDRIKSFEWNYHIERDKITKDSIKKYFNCRKVELRITHLLMEFNSFSLLRVPSYMHFDNDGTGFELICHDPCTRAKWYRGCI